VLTVGSGEILSSSVILTRGSRKRDLALSTAPRQMAVILGFQVNKYLLRVKGDVRFVPISLYDIKFRICILESVVEIFVAPKSTDKDENLL